MTSQHTIESAAIRVAHNVAINQTLVNGGYTFWFDTYYTKQTSGYVVGNNQDCVITKGEPSLYQFNKQLIYAHRNGYHGVGLWVDNGMWYMDAVRYVGYIEGAVSLAKENQEIAIYDLHKQECITINY